MKKSIKIFSIVTIFVTLSTCSLTFYYYMDSEYFSINSQITEDKESNQNEPFKGPNSSTVSLNITKTANILDGLARDVVVVGSLAFVPSEVGGLKIINISDPTAPTKVGKHDDGGSAVGVYVSGSYAYVADGGDGLEVLDISDPTAPLEVGQYDDGGVAMGVYVSGFYAYVADGTDGLEVIDISDPTAPFEVGQYDDGGRACAVFVSGSVACVADEGDGLEMIDISDPTTPLEVGQYDDGSYAYGVHVSDNLAYVADLIDGLEIINISDPSAPSEVGEYAGGGMWAYDVYISGSYAYMAEGYRNGLVIIDVLDPTVPSEMGRYYDDEGQGHGVYVLGDYAYVADLSDGLEVINVSDPTAPSEVGEYDEFGYVYGVHVSGSYAYMACDWDGLRIIDVSDPTAPSELGQYVDYSGISRNARNVYVSGSYAYLTYGVDGLKVINISDPTAPSKVGEYNGIYGSVENVHVSGSYAYLAEGSYGLKIINISDPTAPSKIGEYYDDSGEAYGVYVVGDYAYVADGGDGLEIIDISDPTAPFEVGQYDDEGSLRDVYISGSYAYVADFTDGLEVIDISDPTAPFEVGQYNDYKGDAYGVFVSGSYAYLADYELEVIDISDPSIPLKVGEYVEGGEARGVYVVGDYVYVADLDDGLEILHITEVEHTITINSPDSSSSWDTSSSHDINWGSTGNISTVNIELYKDNSFEQTIVSGTSNDGSYSWMLPSSLAESTQYQVKIIDSLDASVYNYSDYFEIYTNSITVTTPDSLSSWEAGTAHTIYWSSTGYISLVNVELYEDDSFVQTIISGTTNDGSYYWDIPTGLADSTLYQIKIIDASDASVFDYSDYFEIYTNSIIVTTPDSLSNWEAGTAHTIYWSSTGYISTVNIELYQSDLFVQTIISGTINNGSFSWMIPSGLIDSTQYQIKIIDALDALVYDYSDYFEIYTNSITVTTPDSSSLWETGTSHYIYWSSMGYISLVNIELYESDSFVQTIISGTINDGSYSWMIPSGLLDSTQYQIKISDASDSSMYDYSDYFEIYTNFITVTTPDSLSSWEEGTAHTIYWSSTGYISTVNIELYENDFFVQTIASDTSNDGFYNWDIPTGLTDSTLYQIKIIDASDASVFDYSDYFEIYTNSITVSDPTSLSSWEIGTAHTICWSSTGYISLVNIELYESDSFVKTIVSGTTNDGSYYWDIPSGLDDSTQYQIKIIDASDALVYDYSDYFEIRENVPPQDSNIPGFELVILLITFLGLSAMLIWKKINLNAKNSESN